MTAALIVRLLDTIFWFWYAMIFARVILSWLRLSPRPPVNRQLGPFVYAVTEPLLRPIRRTLLRLTGDVPLDFSPLIAYLLLQTLHTIILRLLL